MSQVHIIDLVFLHEDSTIAAFLIETNDGPVLIETGPESTWEQLEAGVNDLGYQVSDIKHVLLTHIHFDHAGAAWKLAELGATIHVHPIGLPHLASPQKLWDSAAQIYGDDMDRLWGEMKPVPAEQLIACDHGQVFSFGGIELKALHTPGHAIHHIAWQLGRSIFTGDVAGVKINNGPVVPPCPPPDIHMENWIASIQLLRDQDPQKLYLTHFGEVNDPAVHLDKLEYVLYDWANWMRDFYDREIEQKEVVKEFMIYTESQLEKHGLNEEAIQRYEYANPSWMSVAGLLRYWKLKDQGRI